MKTDDTIIKRCLEGTLYLYLYNCVGVNKFVGEMVINNRRIPNPELSDEEKANLFKQAKYKADGIDQKAPFLFLTLDLPPKPLYVDPHKQISIPQVPYNSRLEFRYQTRY